MLGSDIFYKLQNKIFSFLCALWRKKKPPLFIPARWNSWVYNVCKFKYWVYWFHFSPAKLYFESPYVLLCLIVSNLYSIYLFIFAVIEQIFTAFLRRFNKNIRNIKEMLKGCVNYFYFIDWVLIRWIKYLSWPSSNDQIQSAFIVVWVFGCLS